MQRKDLALRVLSTAAIMSIVTSIAAPAFAGTYYMGNGDLSIRQDEYGKVYVKSGNSKELEDTDKEVIICGGAGENKWSNAPSGGAAAATGTEGSAAGESQPDPNAGSTLNETKEDSAQTQEGSAQTKEGSAQTREGSAQTQEGSAQTQEGSAQTREGSAQTKEDSAQTKEDSAQTQQGKDNTKEEDTPKDPSTEPAPTTSADPEEKTLKTTQADTTTTPAAEEPSTELEDVTVDTYKPAAPTSKPSSNWISVINNCVDKVLKIRLRDVNLKKTSDDDTAPMTVEGSGNTTTTIELDGNNVLDASTPAWNHTAGLEKKGAGTLTITDTDPITAKDGTTQDNTLRGSLTATGGYGYAGGAGIGSRGNEGATSVTIENITIEGNAYVSAQGMGNASGIGGGYRGNATNITIKDNAYVVANGGGAGIGSGIGGGSSDVKIQGGTVVAEGSYTGIGGHCRGSDTSETSTIEISGGTVYANGQYGRDGVSIGSVGGNSEITISGNAKVKNIGQMGSYGASQAEAEKINATITIKDDAMIADDSGAIGGNTNTNITIQDHAVIGNLRKFGPRPNEWSGYIGTCTSTSDRIYDAKATVQIKDNVLIKDVAFIGGKYITSDVKIKIQDNAHIKKIDTSGCNVPAVGSDLGKVDVTIGGSSDPNKPQQGTVRIDEAIQPVWGSVPVIGTGSGSGNVSIKENVQLGLVRADTKHYKTPDYVKSDKVITPGDLRGMIGNDSTISLKNGETNELEYIVHGQNVCANVDGEETHREEATCTKEGYIEYTCNYEHEHGATGNSCGRTWRVPIPKKDHTWGEWTITPATCTTAGEKKHTCTECGHEETEPIPALDHLWREDHRTGNCGVAGDIYYVCERDSRHTKTEHVEATGNHTWGEWTIVTEATCTSNGSKERECSVCHKKETETIPATGHHWKDNGDGTHTCPDCGASEGQPFNTNSALELRVVDAEGMDQPFTVSQNGTLRTYTGAYDIATLTGDLNTLRYLQDHGAQTIQFVTNGQTSSFAINDLLAQGSGSEVFYLTHRGAEEPTLLLVEADHSDLVKD
jgi:hypothetical protein